MKNNQEFQTKELPLEKLKTIGITEQELEKDNGKLRKELEKGAFSDLIPVQITKDGVTSETEARIRIFQKEGESHLSIYAKIENAQVPNNTRGINWSEEDKKSMQENGLLNRQVPMLNDKGEIKPRFIHFDKETGIISTMLVKQIRLPDKIKEAPINDQQKESILAGKPTLIADLVNAKNGGKYDAIIKIDVLKKGLSIHPQKQQSQKMEVSEKPQEKVAEKEKKARGVKIH